jgi:hypothetical protein
LAGFAALAKNAANEFDTIRDIIFRHPVSAPAVLSDLSSPAPWYRQIVTRVTHLWPLKAFGTMAFMALFFWGYFGVLQYPLTATTVMPLTFIDQWVAFTPLAFPAYASLWFYASLPPALMQGLRGLLLYGVWIAALCLSGLAIFWLFPTSVPPAGIDWAQYPEMAMIKGLDAGGNAFPSLHVAAAVFSGLWLARQLRAIEAPALLHWLNAAHCLAIVWSTLATRQHVALDVLAGIVMGLLFATVSLRHIRAAAPSEGL